MLDSRLAFSLPGTAIRGQACRTQKCDRRRSCTQWFYLQVVSLLSVHYLIYGWILDNQVLSQTCHLRNLAQKT